VTDNAGEDRPESTQESAFDESRTWEDIGVSESVRRALADMEYERPTPVQAESIPKLLAGKDLLVRSKTGTGKTTAFAIPILERIPDGANQVRALVLAPTRELAIQVSEEVERLGAYRKVRSTAIYGGVALGPQIDALEAGAEVVVGTPGRLLDHIRRGNLKLDGCVMVGLDEADEMLSMGFLEEVSRILDNVPPRPQMLLFSATVEANLRSLVQKYANEPEDLFLSTDTRTVEGVDHVLYETTDEYPKPRQLMTILDIENPESGIIFCTTREDVSMLGTYLSRQGIDAEYISSDLTQKARERVMGRIKRGEIKYLVATDIASRGIDISDLTHVINYALPEDPASYLHRVGRTARIGKTGTAVSLMSGRELGCRKTLENTWGIEFDVRKLPSVDEARRMWADRHVAEIEKVMETVAFDAYVALAREIRERDDGDLLLATALRGFFLWSRMEARKAAGIEIEHQERRDRGPRPGGGGRGRGGGGRGGGGRGGGGRGGGGRGGRHGGGGGGRDPRRGPRRDGQGGNDNRFEQQGSAGGDGGGKKKRRRRRKKNPTDGAGE